MKQQYQKDTWWESRLPFDWQKIKEILLGEQLPEHMRNWWFATGGIPLFLFGSLVVTGILLVFNYIPNPPDAYHSIEAIHHTSFGLWLRTIHKWSAEFFVVTLILHALRVSITGAFRKPREFTWVAGALLLMCVFTAAFTGYSLVYNHISYWAIVIGANIAGAVPIVGDFMANFLRGGAEITPDTWQRLFALHAFVMPLIIGGLLSFHLVLVRKHEVAEIPGANNERTYSFFPEHMMLEVILFILLLFVFTIISIISPPHVGEMADPSSTPLHIKPEWYFWWMYRWLKFVPLSIGVMVPVIGAGIFIGWPFIDNQISKVIDIEKFDYSAVLAVIVSLTLMALTIWEALA